jgi:glucokinase
MAATFVGCDLGGTAIKVVRLAAGGAIRRLEVPTVAADSPAACAARIGDAVAAVLRGPGATRAAPGRAVGVAVPGFLDPSRRRIVRLSNLPRLDGSPFASLLEGACKALVVLDADTNAGLVAEARRGAGRGRERVLYVTLGTGLGAAFAIGGQPVRVSRHTIGQVAHWTLPEAGKKGPRCYCGSAGCAETLLSARGVLWRARRLGLEAAASASELCDLARRPGRARETLRARRLWREHGELLGQLLHPLCAFISPDVVVVGGGIAGAAPLFLPAAAAHLEQRLTPRLVPPPALRAARLGRFAGAIGAALLAQDAWRAAGSGTSVQAVDGRRGPRPRP